MPSASTDHHGMARQAEKNEQPMKILLTSLVLLTLFHSTLLFSQDKEKKVPKVKTGWTFGAVPAIAYDSDVGFRYGALANFYNYGDGSTYPKYLHSLYLEWSRTTKGSGTNQFTYDSEYLIPGVRTSAEFSYLTEQALDFYGFNGYNAYYNANFEDDQSPEYKSRMFYRMDRKLLRLKTDFMGKIGESNFHWLAGYAFYGIQTDTVDIQRLNKGQPAEDRLPDVGGGLFQDYVRWGLIPAGQVNGGNTNLLKLGAVYDTRDNEPNPMKGIWTEVQLLMAPRFLGNGDLSYSRIAITHRQYFTILPDVMNFAYRLSYQAKIGGEMPYYMLPFVFNTAPGLTRDGLGGGKTVRGVLRNRVVGEDFFYGNLELRYKVIRTIVLNQNVYIALAGFLDGGMVTGKYKLPPTDNPEAIAWLARGDEEKMHMGYGGGLHIALNENFIVTADYGIAADPRDGDHGLYIVMDFLF